jgi:hypothetical protein
MNVAAKAESVYFSIKGQVVIPRRLRKEFELRKALGLTSKPRPKVSS